MKQRFFRGTLKTFSALYANAAIAFSFVGAVIPKDVLILEYSGAILCIIVSILIETYLEKQ